MRRMNTLAAVALALMLGLAAPCVHAQHHGGGGGSAPHSASAPHASAPHSPPQNHSGGGGNAGHSQAGAPNRSYPSGSLHQQARGTQPPAGYRPQGGAPNNAYRPQNGGGAPPQNAVRAPQSANTQRPMQNLPPNWAQKLQDRSPEEQQRFMQNNERFRSLPPDRQAQVRQNLQKWNNLSPTERNAIRDRQETWGRMSPDQKQYVQRTLLPKWQSMSPDRKQVVTGRLHTLQQMPPAQRQAALNDPHFMQGLSPDEQSMLRGLDAVRNPQP
jgi:predicted Fe-S protein YdhL (DUF1289 family)